MEVIERRIRRLADLYALTADMVENETGDLRWSAIASTGAVARLWREEGGLMVTVMRGNVVQIAVYYVYPGEAGDCLHRAGFGLDERWTAVLPLETAVG